MTLSDLFTLRWWLRLVGMPQANFTTEQIRRILTRDAGLREYNELDKLPAGFNLRSSGKHIIITWTNPEVSPLYAARAYRALSFGGYRGHLDVAEDPENGTTFMSIRLPERTAR